MMGARSAENPVWEAAKAQPGQGVYPAVFDYALHPTSGATTPGGQSDHRALLGTSGRIIGGGAHSRNEDRRSQVSANVGRTSS